MRILGASPLVAWSHSVGVAISSPALSRVVMSTMMVGGSAAGSWIFLPCLAIVPWSARSRSMRFSSTRSAFFRPNSRAISRVPTLPGCARMNATMASRSGKLLSRCLLTCLAVGLAHALLRDGLWRLRGRRLGGSRHRRARLAGRCGGVRFPFRCGFFRSGLLGWLLRGHICLDRRFLCRSLFLASRGLAAALGGALVDQRNGLLECDSLRRLVARQRGVDTVDAAIGAIAAVLHGDGAAGLRSLAGRLAGIAAEAP